MSSTLNSELKSTTMNIRKPRKGNLFISLLFYDRYLAVFDCIWLWLFRLAPFGQYIPFQNETTQLRSNKYLNK